MPGTQALVRRRTAELFDFGDAAVLVLRAERHEDGTEQCQRDADEKAGVLKGADELIAHVLELGHHPHHVPTLTCDTGR